MSMKINTLHGPVEFSIQNNIWHAELPGGSGRPISVHVLAPKGGAPEEKALMQLAHFASVKDSEGHGVHCACGTPDIHPGVSVPVGSVVATPPQFVIPSAIGSDINCGMRLVALDISKEAFLERKPEVVRALSEVLLEAKRAVGLHVSNYRALFSAGGEGFLDSLTDPSIRKYWSSGELWHNWDAQSVKEELGKCVGIEHFKGSDTWAPSAYSNTDHPFFRDPDLATIGSGNHFVEVGCIEELGERTVCYQEGLKKGQVAIMIHCGARSFGFAAAAGWGERAQSCWPKGRPYPASGIFALGEPYVKSYIENMHTAAWYSWLNRTLVDQLIRKKLQEVFGKKMGRLVVDVPHNIISQEDGLWVHRKGATSAHEGQLGVIPGSMGDDSYLVLGLGNEQYLKSCSHGAGRSVRRGATHKMKFVSGQNEGFECYTTKTERLLEEHPGAYKSVGPVIDAQIEQGLIKSVARLAPLMTFKS